MRDAKQYSIELGGKTLTATFSDMADQANGSVLVHYGDTAVLATAVMSKETRDGIDFFPLSVEYEEKFYAAGKILGSRYVRREGKPSDEAILTGRGVDRTIRPLFDHRMRNDVQVVITVLSIGEDDPDVLAVNAASLALATSDIPWNGPVSAVRIGKNGGDGFAVNPHYDARSNGNTLDMLACGRKGAITMVEVGAKEASEDVVIGALTAADKEIEKLQDFQEKIISEIGKEKATLTLNEPGEEIVALFNTHTKPQVKETLTKGKEAIHGLRSAWLSHVKEALEDAPIQHALDCFEHATDEALHDLALSDGARADGRAFDEVRPLKVQAGDVAPMIHGTGLFYRGGTHVLSALTLGGPGESQTLEGIEVSEDKRYIHHYNFPPFSVGETGRVGGFNRRAIGHGALAEKALLPVLPSQDDFPYTIRIVSEVMASNGSSSMASVCGSSLALMDAGVPITRPVAGIAMGLISNEKEYKVLTDIQGPEDHYGDMDFKVAGTREGVTAIQMDTKLEEVPLSVLVDALEAAKKARLHILDVIEKEIATPRESLSPHAPQIEVVIIPQDKIGLVIGSGGKTVNGIKDETGTEIDIHDDGRVFITGSGDGPEKAAEHIRLLTKEYEKGERYTGKVARILDFGAFVTIGPDTDGLVHISEIAPFRVNKVTDVLSPGEEVPVMVKEVDEQGRINLSIKDADKDFAARKGVTPPHTNGGGSTTTT